MNKRRMQTGILITVLVIPVSIFLLLVGFGENHYDLPHFYTKVVIERNIEDEVYPDTVYLDEKKEEIQTEGLKIIDTIFHQIPAFSFINQEGKTITNQDLEGTIYVVDFFFTRCGNPDFCPRMSSELKRIQEKFKDKPVRILSHTIDPEYDNVEVLNEYALRYNANAEKWYFLTGDKKEIYEIAYKGYRINAVRDTSIVVTPEFTHASEFILVDGQGRIRGIYTGIDKEEVDRLMLEIEVLLSEQKNI